MVAGEAIEDAVNRQVWSSAEAAYGLGLKAVLVSLIDAYERKPGKDEIVRVSAEYIGRASYDVFRHALVAVPSRHVRYYDCGWHLELRSRFWEHVVRGLQRQLISSSMGNEVLVEDLLAHDIGV